MDEIQYATERDLAIRNVDRDSKLLRQVKAALIRVHAGHFGTCLDCEESISPKRANDELSQITCRSGQEVDDGTYS
jgi:DnaK suppressor protein